MPIEKAKQTIELVQVDKEKSVNWLSTTLIVVLINILLIAAGFFLFKFIKKRAAKKQAKLLEKLALS